MLLSNNLIVTVMPCIVLTQDKSVEPAYGVEVLRWWVAHTHTQNNIMIGPNILAQFSEALFKVCTMRSHSRNAKPQQCDRHKLYDVSL